MILKQIPNTENMILDTVSWTTLIIDMIMYHRAILNPEYQKHDSLNNILD